MFDETEQSITSHYDIVTNIIRIMVSFIIIPFLLGLLTPGAASRSCMGRFPFEIATVITCPNSSESIKDDHHYNLT